MENRTTEYFDSYKASEQRQYGAYEIRDSLILKIGLLCIINMF